jgi:predicted nucleic-acid-binding protein
MIGLDSSVLVRLFAEDDVAQRDAAVALIDELQEGESAYINAVVIAEFVWTLHRVYKFNRYQIGAALRRITEHPKMVVWDRDIVRNAAHLYLEQGGGVADYLIALMNIAAGCTVTYTFDEEASASRGFSLIKV